MSSVLRPVGPERQGVYWFRRVIILVVVLALVILIVHELAGGSSGPNAGAAAGGGGGSPTPSPTTSATSTPSCTPSQLSIALSTDKREYASDEAATFTGTFRNTSGTTCRLRSTVKSRIWTVTSGSATTWTTAGCKFTGKPKKATLTATSSATTSITWDGRHNDSSCTTGAAALPGTYVLRGTFDGVTAKPAVFHVVS